MGELKTVFINGGSRGIGEAMVRLFSEKGYRVAFSYFHSQESARVLAKETGAFAVCADSANEADIARAVELVKEKIGTVDILINNAAVSFVGLYTDMTDEGWDKMIAVNLKAPEKYIRLLLPGMISQKRGKIINISSMWGQVGASCEVHYSTTKAAVIGLTRALAKELGPSGITVNAIAPGMIETDMNAHLSDEDKNDIREQTPLMRIGTPRDIALSALFLAEEGGDFITGQVLSPNGGFVI